MCGQRGSGMTVVAVATPAAAGLSNGLHPLTASSPLHADASSGPRTDACVGTCSASTMTEPECLGPCEPGTAVTLEGIVWHETEGGNTFYEITAILSFFPTASIHPSQHHLKTSPNIIHSPNNITSKDTTTPQNTQHHLKTSNITSKHPTTSPQNTQQHLKTPNNNTSKHPTTSPQKTQQHSTTTSSDVALWHLSKNLTQPHDPTT